MPTSPSSNSSGNFVWAKRVGGDAPTQWYDTGDRGYDIAVDSDRNVYTTGTFRGKDVDFNPDPNVQFLLTSSGTWDGSAYYNDAFVWKLDSGGNFVWAKRLGGPAEGHSIAVDAQQECLHLRRCVRGGPVFLCGRRRSPDSVGRRQDALRRETESCGRFRVGERLGQHPRRSPTPVRKCHSDWIARDVSTSPGSSADRTWTSTPAPARGSSPAAAAPTCSSLVWTSRQAAWCRLDRIGGTSDDLVLALATGPAGSVYATGSFQGTVDFDPGDTTQNVMSAGGQDAFVLKLVYGAIVPGAGNRGSRPGRPTSPTEAR